jgi:hypothetical protein
VSRPKSVPLAWVGWETMIPDHWRPLRVEGDWDKGNIIVGNGEQAVFQIKWRRTGRTFRGDRWVERKVRKSRAKATKPGPTLRGFGHTAWSPTGGRKAELGALWYGHAPDARMIAEIVVAAAASKADKRRMEDRVIPKMQATALSSPTRWAVFGSSFESPAGFTLARRRLHLGDVVLELNAPDKARLTLRQVYPAVLALARRKMPEWLEFMPFREGRKFKGSSEEWTLDTAGGTSSGLRRTGRKRIPFPLGIIAPRHSVGAVLHDTELHRLLIAECDTRREARPQAVAHALRAMNWAERPGGGS